MATSKKPEVKKTTTQVKPTIKSTPKPIVKKAVVAPSKASIKEVTPKAPVTVKVAPKASVVKAGIAPAKKVITKKPEVKKPVAKVVEKKLEVKPVVSISPIDALKAKTPLTPKSFAVTAPAATYKKPEPKTGNGGISFSELMARMASNMAAGSGRPAY